MDILLDLHAVDLGSILALLQSLPDMIPKHKAGVNPKQSGMVSTQPSNNI